MPTDVMVPLLVAAVSGAVALLISRSNARDQRRASAEQAAAAALKAAYEQRIEGYREQVERLQASGVVADEEIKRLNGEVSRLEAKVRELRARLGEARD